MNVKILADSACDLSEQYYNEFAIEMIPLTVHLDEKDFQDGKTISAKTVYDAMREGKSPKTSQASAQAFKTIFTSYAETNQPLIYFAFSSELSGTYQAAKMMEQEIKENYPDAPIYAVDTKCASIGYGLVVLRAAQLAKNGASVEEILETATYHANHMEHIFTVDDLEYLYRGGRVSKTAAFVGSLLKIKPILHVDDGKLIPLEKMRGSKKLLARMVDIMDERGVDINNQVIGISHGDDLERAEQLAEMIKEKFQPKDIVIEMVGSVIGAHSGPGTLALFFLNDQYK
ncbi:DegV family EDD domain-containing protein [Virgibacillus dakarensis]|uniref:DegV domain-containing protein YitS n=1 Tax=Lentibacillus populi TaxID=1827502 RepID=A0A9W5TWZ7_9BACI|nr:MULTISPECIES: DegV family protein [Bacillaceae]MTW85449.1 DegV family EDD domain-containing protein [Virgibacillus dakarensis]GGB39748.1 DegV domain-containing protein YitS [Lentibacillus populi]